jgi:hypothetical protein
MDETLLAASEIKLFGRVVCGLKADLSGHSSLGDNLFVKKQLMAPDARFARIYAFSYEGQYYVLPKPAIFLVHGDGVPAKNVPGVAAKVWEFLGDILAWPYDKGDFSVRLDIETGPLDTILLEEALKSDHSSPQYGSSKVHLGSSKVHLRNPGGS